MTVQKAGFCQLHAQVQSGLSAHVGKQTVRFFLLDDLFDDIYRQRLNINLVGNVFICHDGCGVGIDQDDFNTFLF